MKKSLLTLLALTVLSPALSARADVFDRIDQCERSGGGSCVYDILRELARSGGGHHGPRIQSGTYTSESYSMTLTATREGFTIEGNSGISERGEYSCNGDSCRGPSYAATIVNPRELLVNYGGNTRTWRKQ